MSAAASLPINFDCNHFHGIVNNSTDEFEFVGTFEGRTYRRILTPGQKISFEQFVDLENWPLLGNGKEMPLSKVIKNIYVYHQDQRTQCHEVRVDACVELIVDKKMQARVQIHGYHLLEKESIQKSESYAVKQRRVDIGTYCLVWIVRRMYSELRNPFSEDTEVSLSFHTVLCQYRQNSRELYEQLNLTVYECHAAFLRAVELFNEGWDDTLVGRLALQKVYPIVSELI